MATILPSLRVTDAFSSQREGYSPAVRALGHGLQAGDGYRLGVDVRGVGEGDLRVHLVVGQVVLCVGVVIVFLNAHPAVEEVGVVIFRHEFRYEGYIPGRCSRSF